MNGTEWHIKKESIFKRNGDNNLTMEANLNRLETLLEEVTELGKTSLELIKLKSVEKSADVVSSVVPHAIVFILFSSFMLFLNLGLAFLLGKLLGNTFYGFFVVAAFYAVITAVVQLFMQKWLKRVLNEYIIKRFFNKDTDE